MTTRTRSTSAPAMPSPATRRSKRLIHGHVARSRNTTRRTVSASRGRTTNTKARRLQKRRRNLEQGMQSSSPMAGPALCGTQQRSILVGFRNRIVQKIQVAMSKPCLFPCQSSSTAFVCSPSSGAAVFIPGRTLSNLIAGPTTRNDPSGASMKISPPDICSCDIASSRV